MGVYILDPFVGTGTFPYRLLTLPDLITDQDEFLWIAGGHSCGLGGLAYCWGLSCWVGRRLMGCWRFGDEEGD